MNKLFDSTNLSVHNSPTNPLRSVVIARSSQSAVCLSLSLRNWLTMLTNCEQVLLLVSLPACFAAATTMHRCYSHWCHAQSSLFRVMKSLRAGATKPHKLVYNQLLTNCCDACPMNQQMFHQLALSSQLRSVESASNKVYSRTKFKLNSM